MLNASLREEETWAAEQEFTTGRGQTAVRAFADRIAKEDEEARRLLEGVLESPYRFTRTNVIARSRFHTGGVVRELCKAAREQCDGEPLYAMQLVEAAQVIAEALPDHYYPAMAVHQLTLPWQCINFAGKHGKNMQRFASISASFSQVSMRCAALKRLTSDSSTRIWAWRLCRCRDPSCFGSCNGIQRRFRSRGHLRGRTPNVETSNDSSKRKRSRQSFFSVSETLSLPEIFTKRRTTSPIASMTWR
jgi:hypothetical protein